MDIISAYLEFDAVELVLLGVFLLFFLIELFFHLYYYKAPVRFGRKQAASVGAVNEASDIPPVSVLIVSSNAAHHLERSLPLILEQDYPNFEVIVVNDGSTDETEELITKFQAKYDNLYGTYLPKTSDNIFGRKKLAMTIGAKAAKNDVILSTEAFCEPTSSKWIAAMVRQMSDEKPIVAGHSYFFEKPRSFASRLIAFDNLMYALQYMSMIIKGRPFSATFRNLAIRKKIFFENKGFASVLNHQHGEELFLNQILSGERTVLCLDPDSFVQSVIDDSESYIWKEYKIAYLQIKKHFRGVGTWIFSLESFSRYALLIIWAILLAKSVIDFQFGGIVVASILSVLIFVIQLVVINKSSKLLRSGKFYFSWPLLSLMQPLRNLYFKNKKNKARKAIGSI
jgi:glycosyltransferase involved in cell wall biosynthesis